MLIELTFVEKISTGHKYVIYLRPCECISTWNTIHTNVLELQSMD